MDYLSLDAIHGAVLQCNKCPLAVTRTQGVAGHGNQNAQVMLVGEAPGRQEDQQGLPFVGAAGKILTSGLAGAGWQREDVWITNLVKSRPPGNRDPLPDEIKACRSYFLAEMELIKPLLIILLGKHALRAVASNLVISQAHGRGFKIKEQRYFASYHPAATIYSSKLKEIFNHDLIRAHEYLDKIKLELGQ